MKKALLYFGLPLLLWPSPGATGQGEESLFDEMVTSGTQWAQENLPSDLLGQLELPSEADWRTFWHGLQTALDSGSLEDLAYLTPYVETGLELLRVAPGAGDYVDWLRERADYFEVADAAVRSYPSVQPRKPSPRPAVPPPPQAPTVVSNRYVRIVPPPRAAAPPPAQVEARRERMVRSPGVWKRKLARRPPPSRAQDLVPRLKRVFKEEGVPPELVWVAEVESSMNPKAKNPAGAAGLFQFMPATAKRFGLRTRPFDERSHPEKSARAAARYLKTLHAEFGSWPLALAAYNAGEGRVGGLLKARRGATFEDIAPFLPVETQMYVPKVQAVVALREGVDLAGAPAPRTGWLDAARGAGATEIDRRGAGLDIGGAESGCGERAYAGNRFVVACAARAATLREEDSGVLCRAWAAARSAFARRDQDLPAAQGHGAEARISRLHLCGV